MRQGEFCVDPKSRHKSVIFNSTKQPLIVLGTLAEAVKKLYPNKNLTEESKVCSNCRSILVNEINEQSSSEDSQSSKSQEVVQKCQFQLN